MDIQLIVTLTNSVIVTLTFIFVIYQKRILKTQIEKQNAIIGNMEKYNNIIDVGKIEDYVKIREKTISSIAELEKRDLEKKIKEINEGVNAAGQMAVDLSSLVFVLLTHHTKEDALKIIAKEFKYDNVRDLYSKAVVKYWDDVNEVIKNQAKDAPPKLL